jgi:hypothetical protein
VTAALPLAMHPPRAAAQAQVLPQAACDFLNKGEAERILGVAVENRSQGRDCWFVQTGWTNKPPNNKAIRFGLVYYPSQRPDDFIDTRKNSRDYLPPGGILTETDFSDAALWLWIPGFGGTLTAFKSGMIQASVNITGVPEEGALREAKALASKPLGGGASTGYAYRGWTKPDSRTAGATAGPSAASAGAPAAAQGARPTAAGAPTSAAPAQAARTAITGTFADAPYLTVGALMRELRQVSVDFDSDDELEGWLSYEELYDAVVNALEDRGIDVVDGAPVQLRARMSFQEHTFVHGDDDGEKQSTDDVVIRLEFITPVAVRRHGAFHVLNAAVARNDGIATVFEGNSVRKAFFGDEREADLRKQLRSVLHDMLEQMYGWDTVDPAPWYPAKWSDPQKAEANAALFAAMRQPPRAKRFDDVDSEPVYSLDVPANEDTCKGRPREWGDAWKLGFRDRGWTKTPNEVESPLRLAHTFWCEYVDVVNVPHYYRLMNVMELKEANAVFALNGRIVRKVVTLAAWANVASADEEELDDVAGETSGLIDAALEEIDGAQK